MVTVTEQVFGLIVFTICLQRLFEMRRSARNESYLLGIGGREASPRHYRIMQVVHALWFVSMLLEVRMLQRPFKLWVACSALGGVLIGQSLRYAAMYTLGRRWTVKIFVVPGIKPVTHGIYRFIRHPNYLGVAFEIAALPLVHGAYITAIAFSALNAWVLFMRIPREEAALESANDYTHYMKRGASNR